MAAGLYKRGFVDYLLDSKMMGDSLQRLDLSEYLACFEPRVQLQTLAAGDCSNLVHLNLSQTKMSVESFTRAIEGCPRLVELLLSQCDLLDDSLVALIFRSCPRLARLDISHCAQLTGECFKKRDTVASLRNLNISWCEKVSQRERERERKFHYLCFFFVHSFVSLYSNYKMCDKYLRDLFTHNKAFTHINAVNVPALSLQTLLLVGDTMSPAVSLDLSSN